MSHFPNSEVFSDQISQQHLGRISDSTAQHVFKKHKGVYLYDLDENKYTDFSLQSGEIFDTHAPKRLTQFIKNALSYGIGHANAHSKFLYKASDLWKKHTQAAEISFFGNLLESILAITKLLNKKDIHIGVNSSYLIKKLAPFNHLFHISEVKEGDKVDLLIFEEIPHLVENIDSIKATKKIQFHSRFLFRRKEITFHSKYEHLIYATPFGGKDLVVLTGNYPSTPLTPADGILLLEGAKYFNTLTKKNVPTFKHELVTFYEGYGILNKDIDRLSCKKNGVIVDDEFIFFSPEHTSHDYKRLSRVLDLYR
ncbi:MAG: hypothetical protein ACRCS8_04975 [Brevinema sp.]